MAGIKELAGVWKNIKEVDLRPFSAEAQRGVNIALIGTQSARLSDLADQLRHDPSRPDIRLLSPVLLVDLQAEADNEVKRKGASQANLLIYLAGSTSESPEYLIERLRDWVGSSDTPLLLIKDAQAEEASVGANVPVHGVNWHRLRLITGPLDSTGFLQQALVPAVLDLLPERHLALGRNFPFFRAAIAQKLIQDTCLSNAAYSLSTGIAEIVPVLDIPLNITDMLVLSKAQAFLVYKLGLVLGFSTRWQDYLAEFGSVLGGGFLWRQVARQLVGLIPAWGIIPKIAVAYAGTYVVGNVVLQWYQTGRKVTRSQMRELYGEAFARGRKLARQMVTRLPRPKSKRSQQVSLPDTVETKKCPQCGKFSGPDAQFCQYCATPLA